MKNNAAKVPNPQPVLSDGRYLEAIFPRHGFSVFDYVLCAILVLFCFFGFCHADIWIIVRQAFALYYGSIIDFYDNVKITSGGATNYHVILHVIFALWFYPLRVLGLIPDSMLVTVDYNNFPHMYWYWAKALTSLLYAVSGWLLYRLAKEVSGDTVWAKYAALLWVLSPFALFTQFIFSQMDITYVCLTIIGVHFFIRNKLLYAAVAFGVAITIKTFPLPIFIVLLLFHEKRLGRLALYAVVCFLPLIGLRLIFGGASGYQEGLLVDVFVARLFYPLGSFELGKLLSLPFFFSLLCGIAYFTPPTVENRVKMTLYLWMAAIICLFFFVLWHPQWIINICPPLALTTMLCKQQKKYLLLDIAGVLFFAAIVSIAYEGSVDGEIFRAAQDWLGYSNQYTIGQIFKRRWFSYDLYFTFFQAYLLLHVGLKLYALNVKPRIEKFPVEIDCRDLRRYFVVGMLVFIAPALFSVCKDRIGFSVANENVIKAYAPGPIIKDQVLEQTFVSHSNASVKTVRILLTNHERDNTGEMYLEIVDDKGAVLTRATKNIAEINPNGWCRFRFPAISLKKDQKYAIRVGSNATTPENAITWVWTEGNPYPDGSPSINGKELAEYDAIFIVTGKRPFLSGGQ